MSIQLVIVDDHPIVLHGLKRLFESTDGFDVVECCSSGDEALTVAATKPFDVMLLDLRMPGRTGIDVLRTLAAGKPAGRTVLLTAAITDDEVVEAVRLGAQGVVMKESSPETLIECVRRVHRGEQWIDRETMGRAFGRVLQKENATREAAKILTPREIEIVRMITQGLRNRAIAERLSISEGTVKIHLHNIYEKLEVDGRLELMLYAQNKGLA
jgi:two-component system, NarL family, nitrate/nitrite response regulator NarL